MYTNLGVKTKIIRKGIAYFKCFSYNKQCWSFHCDDVEGC